MLEEKVKFASEAYLESKKVRTQINEILNNDDKYMTFFTDLMESIFDIINEAIENGCYGVYVGTNENRKHLTITQRHILFNSDEVFINVKKFLRNYGYVVSPCIEENGPMAYFSIDWTK